MASQRRAGAILGYANIIVKNLVNLVYTPMRLAFVCQADYGVYQTANSFVFSLTLLTFGFSNAYIRFYALKRVNGTEEDVRSLNGMYLVLYAVVSVVALALGLLFAANVGAFFSGSFTPDETETAWDADSLTEYLGSDALRGKDMLLALDGEDSPYLTENCLLKDTDTPVAEQVQKLFVLDKNNMASPESAESE